jgi:hypothetical protein
MCSSWLISVIGIQPFRFCFKFGTAVPLGALSAVSGLVLAPFSVAQGWFVFVNFGALVIVAVAVTVVLIAEPASFVFRSWGLSIFARGESALFLGCSCNIEIPRAFFVFPTVKLAVASRLAFLIFWTECATRAPRIPVFSLPAPAIQWPRLAISCNKVFICGIAVFEESISEVESVILLVRVGLPSWPFRCQVEGSFAANTR